MQRGKKENLGDAPREAYPLNRITISNIARKSVFTHLKIEGK